MRQLIDSSILELHWEESMLGQERLDMDPDAVFQLGYHR